MERPAGVLSFYSVSSDKLSHLLTFSTTFTQPLTAGFGLRSGSGSGGWMGGCVRLQNGIKNQKFANVCIKCKHFQQRRTTIRAPRGVLTLSKSDSSVGRAQALGAEGPEFKTDCWRNFFFARRLENAPEAARSTGVVK